MDKLNVSKTRLSFLFILMAMILIMAGCATTRSIYYEECRKGYICEASAPSVVVVHGQKTGAWIGQELEVYELVTVTRAKQAPLYKKVYKGRIKITEIIDDYHSRAIVLSGVVKTNYQTEL